MSEGSQSGLTRILLSAEARLVAFFTIIGGLAALYQAFGPSAAPTSVPPSSETSKPWPLEQAFNVKPTWFGRDLMVSISKVRTDRPGRLAAYACTPNSTIMRRLGESAYASTGEEFIFNEQHKDQRLIVLLHLEPNDKDPVTVISSWDLENTTRLREPILRSGLITCAEIKGQF